MSQASGPTPAHASKPPTIYEVARLAGVSHQTVSRYLKGNGGLKPATVVKVEGAMAELNYSPNPAARALRSKQAYRVLVVVPEGTQTVPPRMLRGAMTAAQEAGYVPDVVAVESATASRVHRLLALIASERLAGIFSLVPLGAAEKQINAAHPELPLVVAGDYDDAMHARGSLADGSAAEEMLEYLASLGHRSFYHVAGPRLWTSAVNRRKSYEKTIARLGLHSAGTAAGDWSMASGYKLGLRIPLDDGPVTAIFAASDQLAIGVIRALHERGKRVPDDVSVFGWDDLDAGKYLVPSLSTVSMDLEAPGRNGMHELISRIRNEPSEAQHYEVLPMRLVLRESTAPPPAPSAR
ncbi:LacI family DNA-binding transcriptional regulator [Sinomonas sp. P47F7]|uniref:LacI family DNA-binding transcriptional regulator n=1 Tax=Sinomonas sp. P47F7 TaxID=3410987 RepID=UPI003BF618CB